MKEFTSHIDYLIQKYDCVIIPDFGGFVLNREVAKVTADGSIVPPRVTVGFNPELRYNDGLLAESYMNAYSITYDAACKRINDAVRRLNTILALRQPIQMGLLGKLSQASDSRLTFEPNNNLSAFHSETFGLSTLAIKRLVDIQEIRKVSVINNKKSTYKKVFAGIGAAAAAILVFFVTSTPIQESGSNNVQKSGFFTDLISSPTAHSKTEMSTPAVNPSSTQEVTPVTAIQEVPVAEIETKKEEPKIEQITTPSVTQKAEPAKAAKVEAPKEKKAAEPKYFVIIGSAGSKSEAEKVLKKFKAEGYQNANVVHSADRSRIYVATFDDKAQAEKYAASFRKTNPKLDDAWVLTKRN